MRRSVTCRYWLLASAGVVAGIAAWVAAGPLNPPSGAVASTYKTLSEVEPRTVLNAANTPGDANSLYHIVAPGSYCLDQNLTCVAGKHGIKIDASNVTLDLRGFTITGVAGSNDGINAPVALVNLTIRNGAIRGCPGSGIFAGSAATSVYADLVITQNSLDGIWASDGCVFERVVVTGNRNGITTGAGARINACAAKSNTQRGIDAGTDSMISGCISRSNTLSGIRAGDSSNLRSCVADSNTSHGFDLSAGRCSATECTATGNGGHGLLGGDRVCFTSCRAGNNALTGISVNLYSSVRSCDLVQNTGDGLSATSYAEILDCNSSLNSGSGIVVNDGCNIQRCNTSNNSGIGILAVVGGCTIADCQVRFNTLDGIAVQDSCFVLNNCCDSNGAAAGNQGGVRLGGTGNRVEGNSLTGNDYNLYCALGTTQNNLIVRNTSRAPTQGHFQLVPGNAYGPAVIVAGVGEITGVANSAHPMANFVY